MQQLVPQALWTAICAVDWVWRLNARSREQLLCCYSSHNSTLCAACLVQWACPVVVVVVVLDC